MRLTQEQLGRQLGLEGRAVYRWECAHSVPRRSVRTTLIQAIHYLTALLARMAQAGFSLEAARRELALRTSAT